MSDNRTMGNMHYETRYTGGYIAKLSEREGVCKEIVFHNGEQIHFAEFPSSNLGSASRGGYLSAMVSSVAMAHKAGRLPIA